VFNNYRIESRIHDDISSVVKSEKYQKSIELENFPVYGQLYSYSCGPTTISMVYSYLEKPKSEKDLLRELDLENRKKGMLPKTFLKYIRQSLKGYSVNLENNITDSQVLTLIYSQLEKGIPVPVYFSTINHWDKPNYDTHFSVVTGIDIREEKVIIANAYGFREKVNIKDFLDSMKYENYKKKPLYLAFSVFFEIIKKNNIYLISQ
jgi:predicted double-glycine peptidase